MFSDPWARSGWSVNGYRFSLWWDLGAEDRERTVDEAEAAGVLSGLQAHGSESRVLLAIHAALGEFDGRRRGLATGRGELLRDIRTALRLGRLVAVREETSAVPLVADEWPDEPWESPVEANSSDHHLPVEVLCEATGKPLPGARFVVKDSQGRVWDEGQTGPDGRATARVKVRGNYTVQVLPNPVESSTLLVLDDAARPLADLEVTLKDSAGASYTLRTDERGTARIPLSAGGSSTLVAEGCEVHLYLDPRLDSHTVRVPGLLGPRATSAEFSDYE